MASTEFLDMTGSKSVDMPPAVPYMSISFIELKTGMIEKRALAMTAPFLAVHIVGSRRT